MTTAKNKGWNWFTNEENNARSSQRAITPWNASSPSLSQLQHNISQLFDASFRNFGWPALTSMPGLMSAQAMFQPNVNIASDEDEYTITVEVPGMEEKSIRLDVSPDGLLTISGEKRQESQNKSKDYECMECSYGTFKRVLSLPEDVDQDAIEANFKNGVLNISCPRTETARSQAKQIPIGGSKANQEMGSRTNTASIGPKKVA